MAMAPHRAAPGLHVLRAGRTVPAGEDGHFLGLVAHDGHFGMGRFTFQPKGVVGIPLGISKRHHAVTVFAPLRAIAIAEKEYPAARLFGVFGIAGEHDAMAIEDLFRRRHLQKSIVVKLLGPSQPAGNGMAGGKCFPDGQNLRRAQRASARPNA